jgi:hypothetical protein
MRKGLAMFGRPIRVFCAAIGVLLAAQGAPAGDGRPERSEGEAQILRAVQAMAQSDAPAARHMAGRLRKVLRANKVRLPERLASAELPDRAPERISERRRALIARMLDQVIGLDQDYELSILAGAQRLRCNSLLAILRDCPSRTARVKAAYVLLVFVGLDPVDEQDERAMKIRKAVNAAVGEALMYALQGVPDRSAPDSMAAIRFVEPSQLLLRYAASLAAEGRDAAAVQEEVALLEAQAGRLSTPKDPIARQVVKNLLADFPRVRKAAPELIEQRAVRPAICEAWKGLVEAIEADDAQAARRCATEPLVKAWSVHDPMSKGWCPDKEVKTMALHGCGMHFDRRGARMVEAWVRYEPKEGQPLLRAQVLRVGQQEGRWLVGAR